MNKIGFCLSGILVILGCIGLIMTTFTMDYLSVQSNIAYTPHFQLTNNLSISIIILGIILCYIFNKKSK